MTHTADDLHFESLHIRLNETDTLHVKRIYTEPAGMPVLMLHGAIENGMMFYSENRKGLAPFLALHGYDVFCGDLRGRGGSTPHLSRVSKYGQTEAIIEDIPAFMKKIIELRGPVRQHWIAHSWGGVLMSSHLARFPENIRFVASAVYFGAKKRVSVINPQRILLIDLVWGILSRILVKWYGYLPISRFGLGSDDESDKSHLYSKIWVYSKDWIGPDDGFNYGAAIKKVKLPPILYLAAAHDACLGNPVDVKIFMRESGQDNARYQILGKEYGNFHDYDHISMITHKDSDYDHFPLVREWLYEHE